jgi:translocation and assembly module TamA
VADGDTTGRRAATGRGGRLCALAVGLAVGLSAVPLNELRAFETLAFQVAPVPDEVRDALERGSLLRALEDEGRTEPLDVIAAARAEYGRLIGLLYEHGYYAPQISVRIDGQEASEIATLQPPTAIRQVAVVVEPGPRFRFGRTEIAPLAPATELPEGFAPGEPARSVLVRDAALAAVDAWQRQGHALAEPADQQITAVHPDSRLDVSVRLAPGPQLRFGALNPRGADAVRPGRVRAIAGLPHGDIYDPEAIADAETRLRRTGAFASVALRTAEAANPDGTIDIEALLDEAPPRRLGFGAEVDTEAGLRLTGFWMHRNLLGGAERLRIEAGVEAIGARGRGLGFSLDTRFRRPATFTRDTDFEIGARVATLDERDYNAETLSADVLLVHRFSPQLTGTAGVLLTFERARFGTPPISRNFATLALPVGLERDTRDNALDATSGTFLAGQIQPYYGFAGADPGARLTLDGRAYYGMGERFVLAGRAQFGAVFGSALDRTPRQFLFYSGGGGTVRGLPFQSLGVEVGGVRSGGRGFAALSGEARARVTPAISLVGFADAGLVSQSAFGGQRNWHAGAGVGLRYDTPVGPLRFDVAMPVRRSGADADGRRFQIYIGIGQAF